MAIQFVEPGTILFTAGGIAMSADCCCDEGGGTGSTCPGCELGTMPLSVQAEIDFATVTVNPDYDDEFNCTEAGCQGLSTTVLLDTPVSQATTNPIFCTFIECEGGGCGIMGTAEPEPCPCIGSFCEEEPGADSEFTLVILKDCDGGHYYLQFTYNYSQIDLPLATVWIRDLGTTEPDCQSLFPITLDSDDLTECHTDDPNFYACIVLNAVVTLTLP